LNGASLNSLGSHNSPADDPKTQPSAKLCTFTLAMACFRSAHCRVGAAHFLAADQKIQRGMELEPALDALWDAAERNDATAIKAFMSQYVQGYQPA
jgi:hypothetical protein